MARFQLIGCEINIGGDRTQTVVKDAFDPVTFPEYIVLRALHGGAEHVHSAVAVGYREVDPAVERERLGLRYGEALVASLFPGAMTGLPTEDLTLATAEEVEAGKQAARAARAAVRKKQGAPDPVEPAAPKAKPGKEALPDLTT